MFVMMITVCYSMYSLDLILNFRKIGHSRLERKSMTFLHVPRNLLDRLIFHLIIIILIIILWLSELVMYGFAWEYKWCLINQKGLNEKTMVNHHFSSCICFYKDRGKDWAMNTDELNEGASNHQSERQDRYTCLTWQTWYRLNTNNQSNLGSKLHIARTTGTVNNRVVWEYNNI